MVKVCPRELPLKPKSEFLETIEKNESTTKGPQPGIQNIALNERPFYTTSVGLLFASPPPNSITSIPQTSTWTFVNDAIVHDSKTDIHILETTLVCADEPTVTSVESTLVGEDVTSSSACQTSPHNLIAVEKASRCILAESLDQGPSETSYYIKTFKSYVQQQTTKTARQIFTPTIEVQEFVELTNKSDSSLMPPLTPCKSNPIDGSAKFKEENAPQALKEEKIASCKERVEEVGTRKGRRSSLNSQELARMFKIGLFEGKTTCPAMTTKKSRETPERCKNPAGAKKRERALETLNNIARMDLQPPGQAVIQMLQQLAAELICHGYHQNQMEDIAKGWALSLFDLSTPAQIAGVDTKECSDQNLTYPQSTRESHSQVVNPVQVAFSNNIDIIFATLSRGFNAPPMFLPYKVKLRKASETRKHLKSIIEKDLSETDLSSEGYIYVYRLHGSFGHIKIGYTTRPVDVRLKEWHEQCGHDLVIEYPNPETIPHPKSETVPHPKPEIMRYHHIRRLEAIVHAELQDCRRIEPRCRKCSSRHKEWFEEALPDALNVIDKWSNWMKQEPYEIIQVGEKTDSQGRVVQEWRGRLKEEHAAALPSMLEPQVVRQKLAPPPLPAKLRGRSLSPNRGRGYKSLGERRRSSGAQYGPNMRYSLRSNSKCW